MAIHLLDRLVLPKSYKLPLYPLMYRHAQARYALGRAQRPWKRPSFARIPGRKAAGAMDEARANVHTIYCRLGVQADPYPGEYLSDVLPAYAYSHHTEVHAE